MKSPEDDSSTLPEHRAGRSFADPRRPLGDGIIDRAAPIDGAHLGHGVAERAKGVSVLRKAEELMASGNPDGKSESGRRRAIELACGRVGVKLDEFDRIVAEDPELGALMTNVMEAARLGMLRI